MAFDGAWKNDCKKNEQRKQRRGQTIYGRAKYKNMKNDLSFIVAQFDDLTITLVCVVLIHK